MEIGNEPLEIGNELHKAMEEYERDSYLAVLPSTYRGVAVPICYQLLSARNQNDVLEWRSGVDDVLDGRIQMSSPEWSEAWARARQRDRWDPYTASMYLSAVIEVVVNHVDSDRLKDAIWCCDQAVLQLLEHGYPDHAESVAYDTKKLITNHLN